jgi:FkbM family methyltransferase
LKNQSRSESKFLEDRVDMDLESILRLERKPQISWTGPFALNPNAQLAQIRSPVPIHLFVHDPKECTQVSASIVAGRDWEAPVQAKIITMLRILDSTLRRRHFFLDVGAGIGPHTMAVAAAGHPVVALEPRPRAAELLEASIALGGLRGCVRLFEAAAGQEPHIQSICLTPSGASPPLPDRGAGHCTGADQALAAPLDGIFAADPALRAACVGVIRLADSGVAPADGIGSAAGDGEEPPAAAALRGASGLMRGACAPCAIVVAGPTEPGPGPDRVIKMLEGGLGFACQPGPGGGLVCVDTRHQHCVSLR